MYENQFDVETIIVLRNSVGMALYLNFESNLVIGIYICRNFLLQFYLFEHFFLLPIIKKNRERVINTDG